MSSIVRPAAVGEQRKTLDDVECRVAKADLKKLDVRDLRVEIGRAVSRTFSLANVSAKEAAGLMARDPAQISRWIAGTERPQFDALFAVDVFKEPLVFALSQMVGGTVRIHIEFGRKEVA